MIAKSPTANPPTWRAAIARDLDALAWTIALAAVIARATFLESVRDSLPLLPGSESVPRSGPGASGSLVLDLLCMLPALLIILRGLLDVNRGFVFRLSHALWCAFAVMAVASIFWADDKFAAMVSGIHLVAGGAILFAATELIRDWQRLRALAGAMLGLLLICVAQSAEYRFVELPNLIHEFENNRAHILDEHGWESDSFTAKQFEQKVVSGELIGFNASANSFAAVLVMLGVVSAGLALQRRLDGDDWGFSAAILPVLACAAIAIWLTQCRAALVTPAFGAGLILIGWKARTWLARHRAAVFVAAITAVLAGTTALIAAGLIHGGLWQDSLTFRWRYWIGSTRMFLHHPILGVGWDNFGPHYLAVRLQSAAEEIQDPHNFVVRAATELGLVGLILILAWTGITAWRATQPIIETESPEPDQFERPRAKRLLGQVASPVLLAIGINIAASIDLSQQLAFVFSELLMRLVFLGVLLLGMLLGCARSAAIPSLDDRAARMLRLAVLAALAGFLLHNMIEFSFFETGPMLLMLLLCGAALGIADRPNQHRRRSAALIALPIAFAIWCAVAVVTAMTLDAESKAQAGEEANRISHFDEAARDYADAIAVSAIPDSNYALHRAEALISARDDALEVHRALTAALAMNPVNARAARLLAQFEMHGRPVDVPAFRSAYDRVLAIDPCDIAARIEFADGLESLGLNHDAATQYREALRRNAEYDKMEPKRLSGKELARVKAAAGA